MLEVFRSVRVCVFFFKQKTAYEMRISDWSSDVCSSDLDCTRDNRRGQMARVAGFRSIRLLLATGISVPLLFASSQIYAAFAPVERPSHAEPGNWPGYGGDRKSTRLNSSH